MTIAYRLSDNKTAALPVPASVAFAIGDLMVYDASLHQMKPLTSVATGGSEAIDQVTVAAIFVGVSEDQRLLIETDANAQRVVCTDGVFDCDCPSQTFEAGDLVGATWNGGAALVNQFVTKVTGATKAIGTVVKPYTTATTTVRVRLLGQLINYPAGVNTLTNITANSITGGDSSLAIDGLAGSGAGGAGGAVPIAGGAGVAHTSGTGGAGGAVSTTGGTGGTATSGTGGAGGAVTTTAPAGGAVTTGTGGAGGAIARTAGAGGAATGAAGIGGAGAGFTDTAGAGGATADTSGGAAGAGAGFTRTAGAGGAAAGTGASVGGAGGAFTDTAGVGGTAAGSSVAGAGGGFTRTAGAGGAKTGTGNAAGGAGGSFAYTAGVGGATASSGANAGGAGGGYAWTAGAGGAASAGTGNGGQGGSLVLTAGVGGTSFGGTAGVQGCVIARGLTFCRKISAPAAKTTSATLTAAEILGGLLTAAQGASGAATYTMPTGTDLQAALPTDFTTGDSFDFSIVNISTDAAEDVTVAGGVGTTAVGNMTIASNAAVGDQAWGTFRVRKTGTNAFSFYRIG